MNNPQIDRIRQKIVRGEFEFSRHAVDRIMLRHIFVTEVREAIGCGEIIEDYPNDKYGPSCLIFGFTQGHRPLHIHCSHSSRQIIKIITVYEPDPQLWVNFRVRVTTL